MKTPETYVSDETASKIEQAANNRETSAEQLIQSGVEEKIQPDAQFESAVGHVLEKNAELYRRLS